MKLNDVIRIIDKYYVNRYQKNRNLILIKTNHTLESIEYSRVKYLKCLILSKLYNVLDTLKATIKKRPSLHKEISLTNTCIPGKISGNFIFGTFVVLGSETVEKFYFKNVDDYLGLYKELYINDCVLHSKTLVLKMPKYNNINEISDVNVKEIIEILDKFEFNYHISNEYDLIKRLDNIFKYNKLPTNKDYLDSAKFLHEKAENIGLKFCHGDLWKDNIMIENSNVKLIDFDKFMWFLPYYDFVYLYLMENVFCNFWSVSSVLNEIEGHLYNYNKTIFPSVDLDIFEINIKAILLLKSAEKYVFDSKFSIDKRLLK